MVLQNTSAYFSRGLKLTNLCSVIIADSSYIIWPVLAPLLKLQPMRLDKNCRYEVASKARAADYCDRWPRASVTRRLKKHCHRCESRIPPQYQCGLHQITWAICYNFPFASTCSLAMTVRVIQGHYCYTQAHRITGKIRWKLHWHRRKHFPPKPSTVSTPQ